jgi:hypothetical protein
MLSSAISPPMVGKEFGESELPCNELGRAASSPEGVEGSDGSSIDWASTSDDSSSSSPRTSRLIWPVLTLNDRKLFSLTAACAPGPDPPVAPFARRALQSLASLSQLPLLELLGLSARTLASKSRSPSTSKSSPRMMWLERSSAPKRLPPNCEKCENDVVSFIPPKMPIRAPGMPNAEEASVSTDALSRGGDEGRGLLRG